ncbi:hypothetical protein OFO99_33935, partial [Escherichia coli]|nr:hypothetical protein [Escherichia coli]
EATNQLGTLEQTNRDLLRAQSLAQNIRVDYGNGVCLIIGVYDLVEKSSGKVLRYADLTSRANPYEPSQSEDPLPPGSAVVGLSTEGGG